MSDGRGYDIDPRLVPDVRTNAVIDETLGSAPEQTSACADITICI